MSNLLNACKEFVEGWPHFCDCIDFNHSHLDADAIRWMNEVPPKIGKAVTDSLNKTAVTANPGPPKELSENPKIG